MRPLKSFIVTDIGFFKSQYSRMYTKHQKTGKFYCRDPKFEDAETQTQQCITHFLTE